jgi:hypothetical protein
MTKLRLISSVFPLFLAGLAFACSGDGVTNAPLPAAGTSDPPASVTDGEAVVVDEDVDGGGNDAAPSADGATPPAPSGLPFPFVRPPAGTPVSASELTALTDRYLDLLAKTRYFDVVDERVHGWPESDPQHRYWYGTWWSGCGLDKSGGKVTYQHVNVGADNNGIPTSFVMEGACLAHAIWPSAKLEKLVRRLVRGFNAYILAMQRSPNDPAGVLLARTVYPPSIASSDGGRQTTIAYDTNRPGIDSYTQYVRIAANPHWGDVWIKNNRSKDDVGHMLRALATLEDCGAAFGPDTKADIASTRAGYAAWAQRVEADGWAIATFNQNANVTMPPFNSTMSRYNMIANAECDAALTLRLFGGGAPGTLDCGDGVHPLEFLAMTNDHNGEIVRSYHEAAARNALLAKENGVAKPLLEGLVKRIEEGLAKAETNALPAHLRSEQLVKLLVESANTGVPLTWREVRWVHAQIDKAYTSYVTNGNPHVYRVFDPATPDGSYVFTPEGDGIDFQFFAVLAGTCSAKLRNPTTAPLLDCARLSMWTP